MAFTAAAVFRYSVTLPKPQMHLKNANTSHTFSEVFPLDSSIAVETLPNPQLG